MMPASTGAPIGHRPWTHPVQTAAMPTIAVIEQDSAMRTLICEWLLGEGYAVLGQGGAEADLVIVDVPDYRRRGPDIVRAVRARHPRSALIGLSTQLGRSLRSDSDPARALGLRRFIAKPCTRDELIGAVHDAIG